MARASFTTLPLELKARIVEMASDQEEIALALVNKELRELASKHQFEVLTSTQASKPIFAFRILRTFRHRVTEIVFLEDSTTTGVDTVFQCMDSLPSLRIIRLSHSDEESESIRLASLFGPIPGFQFDPKDDMRTYRVELIASIAPQIETLVLNGLPSSVCAAFIRHFPSLKTLGLINVTTLSKEEHVRDLASAIASLRRLNSLTIDLGDETDSDWWSDDALAPLERNPPPIQILQLTYFPLDVPIIRLTQIFSSSIKTLCLQLIYGTGAVEADLTSITPIRLPLLNNFILYNRSPFQSPEISRLLLSTSTLTSFSHALGRFDKPPTSPLLSVMASQPSLRRVEIGGTVQIFPIPAASTQASSTPHLSPFYLHAKLEYTERELHLLTSALGRTLAFGQVELERMIAEGDVKKAVGWVKTLKALENERLAWSD
ncbi:hypothetical protein RQP46_002435 [Phenoliferia psychrophenolica]